MVCSSGGNAGLAAAYSARKLNIPCSVVVPGTTPTFMVERLREEGATVQICGNKSEMPELSVGLGNSDELVTLSRGHGKARVDRKLKKT